MSEFFNQPLFHLSQTNLRDLERSVSPKEIIANDSEISDLPEPSNDLFNDMMQGQIDLSLASSNNPTAVMELDMDGNIRYLSKNWEIIVGTKVKKMIHKPISNFIIGNNEDDMKVFNHAIEKMIKDDDSYTVRFVTATNDQVPSYDENITPNNSVEDSETDLDLQQENVVLDDQKIDTGTDTVVEQVEFGLELGNPDFDPVSGAHGPEDGLPVSPDREEFPSDTSSKVSNNGEIIELEGQGILIHDSKTNLPTHSIWTLKPFVPLDLDLTIPDQLMNLLGFGSTIFENFLMELKRLKISDEQFVPPPQTVLCRICEQQIPAWFLERHSDLCIVEHRTSEDLQLCHDLVSDQKELITKIVESLYNQTYYNQLNSSNTSLNSSGSSTSNSSLVILEYKGLPLPNLSNDQLNVPHPQSNPMLPIKKFPFGILSRLLEFCDEALAINPIEINENGEPKFSPNTERAINVILNFKPFETTDQSIKLIIQDTQNLINDKIDTLSRLFSILKISERVKKQVDELVLASVSDTVGRINEQLHSNNSASNSILNSALNSPLDLSSPIHHGMRLAPLLTRFSLSNVQSPQPVVSPNPTTLQSPGSFNSDLDNGREIGASITPKDILLRGRKSNDIRPSNSVSSLSSTRSGNTPKDLVLEDFTDLNLTGSRRSDLGHSSPRPSPLMSHSMAIPHGPAVSHNYYHGVSHNLSSFQRNTPSSSPQITHSQLHDPIGLEKEKPFMSLGFPNMKLSNKPPLSPLLVSQGPTTKPSTGSIKDYEIIKAISKGAFGSVFLAKRKLTGDYVAIKCLKKSDMIAKNQILNVKSERAVMMKQTDSPYVAQLYSSFQTTNYLYLVMEYLNGGDCATLLKMLQTLGNNWTKRYISEVIVGVDDLHSRGIIHRDLKPDNLLIDSTGHLKLTDFGLSRVGVIGRQSRLQRKSSTSEQGVELFRKNLAMTGGSGSPRLNVDSPLSELPLLNHKRTNSVTPFSLSPTVDLTRLGTSGSIPSPNSDHMSRSGSTKQQNSISKFDSPNSKPNLPRTSSETSFAIVDDAFHVDPSQRFTSEMITSYTIYDPLESNEDIKFVGTPDYLAPETIRGVGQSEASDWWSLGCIMFEFLFGYPPFHSSTPQEVFTNILDGKIEWPKLPPEEFNEMCPPSAKNLIERLLTVNPAERLGYGGADEIKRHPYFKGIDWDNLFNEIPSFIPTLDDPEATDYFDQRGADISQFPKDDSSDEEKNKDKDLDVKLRLHDNSVNSFPSDNSLEMNLSEPASGNNSRTGSASTGTGGSLNLGTSTSAGPASILSPANSGGGSRRGSLTLPSKRERRGSKLADPSEFGSFHFRNLNVLEKANKDVINRLKSEHLEHRGSFSSSSSENTPLRSRGLSSGNSDRPSFNLNFSGQSGSFGLGLGSGDGPNSSSGSTPLSAQTLNPNHSPGYFGSVAKDISPFKRPVSPMLTSFNRAPSPMKEALGSPHSMKHERVGSGYSSDDVPDFGKLSPGDIVPSTIRHRSSGNSLSKSFKDSPNSSDTEDNSRALMRVQKRRESSRRKVVNIKELDILYCEPIPIVRHVITKYFERLGCIVVIVHDGDELIRRATGQVKFDLIFTALKLPKIEGIDAIKLIKNINGINSSTPMIAITAFAKEASSSNQFNQVLEKPVEFETLKLALNKFRADEAVESDGE